MAGGNFTANGLTISADNRTMYGSNTPDCRIDQSDFDVATAAIANRGPGLSFDRKVEGLPYLGRPDGAAVDAEGNYWAETYKGACALQLSTAGEVLQRIAVPVRCSTMVCFGEADLRTLYITSAREGRPVGDQEANTPTGSMFSVRVKAKGLPVNLFKR